MGDWSSDETADCQGRLCFLLHGASLDRSGEGGRNWQLADGELTLKQTYQMISGTLKRGSNTMQIANGKLNGDQITFNAGGSLYTGRVNEQWHGRDDQHRRQLEGDSRRQVAVNN